MGKYIQGIIGKPHYIPEVDCFFDSQICKHHQIYLCRFTDSRFFKPFLLFFPFLILPVIRLRCLSVNKA